MGGRVSVEIDAGVGASHSPAVACRLHLALGLVHALTRARLGVVRLFVCIAAAIRGVGTAERAEGTEPFGAEAGGLPLRRSGGGHTLAD